MAAGFTPHSNQSTKNGVRSADPNRKDQVGHYVPGQLSLGGTQKPPVVYFLYLNGAPQELVTFDRQLVEGEHIGYYHSSFAGNALKISQNTHEVVISSITPPIGDEKFPRLYTVNDCGCGS